MNKTMGKIITGQGFSRRRSVIRGPSRLRMLIAEQTRGRCGSGEVVVAAKNINSLHPGSPGNPNSGFQQSDICTIQYTYPLKILTPEYASTGPCRWVYPVTFGGGLVEGDCISLKVTVLPQTAALVTTQSTTKVYHCDGGQTTQQHMEYRVAAGALLAVLPDPIQPHRGALYTQTQEVDMVGGSNLVMLDWVTAGRVARCELWDFIRYQSTSLVRLNGSTVFRDSMVLEDTPLLGLREAMHQYQVVGVLLLLGPLIHRLLARLLTRLGQPKDIDGTYGSEQFVSVSPVKYRAAGCEMDGWVVRIAAPSTTKAFQSLECILKPLHMTLGGDPFDGKY